MKRLLLIVFLTAGLLMSCDKSPQAINYGEDGCAFCSMTIVDATHAAQVVTQKGRNYKFDATECMVHFLESEIPEKEMLHVLSANYLNAGELVDAREATFIITENIPSPMGAFLSAIESKEEANTLQKDVGGELYTWEEVKKQIANKTH